MMLSKHEGIAKLGGLIECCSPPSEILIFIRPRLCWPPSFTLSRANDACRTFVARRLGILLPHLL